MATPLAEMMRESPYISYPYAYPHKTAYRLLESPIPLQDLWATEDQSALFLYLHIPFCKARCGYCNLFTIAHPEADFQAAYLDTLERQARQVRTVLKQASFARLAIGGGTPTYLDLPGLHKLFDIVESIFDVDPRDIPVSVETSPGSAETAKLQLLYEHGVDRISIGVQSFVEAETAAAGRVQKPADVEQALSRIRTVGFPTLNIDLIYGLPGQTVESWLTSLQAALRFTPEEFYLYPLYVRPLTGLGHTGAAWDDVRLACYRAGRDFLLDAGYEQLSMRMFRANHAPTQDGPLYCCQEDGMVGLGCGARSYTKACHYASEYAIGRAGVHTILKRYIAQSTQTFGLANHVFKLDLEEQHRRYVIKSLLRVDGLDCDGYQTFFGSNVFNDLAELAELLALGLATHAGNHLRLTEAGLERSDMIGPWLYSAKVRELIESYELR